MKKWVNFGNLNLGSLATQIKVPPSARKKFWPSNQAGEKEGSWGEGIFARLFCAVGAVGWEAFPPFGIKTFRQIGGQAPQNNFQIILRKIWRAGVKKLKENYFALLAEVRRAETRSGAIQAFFVQKRFELRSVIATKLNFFQNQDCFVARSPRLRRVSLRKKPCPPALFQLRRVNILELNRKVGQIQIQFFGKANGGSACEARNKQSLFPIFSIPPEAEHKASF